MTLSSTSSKVTYNGDGGTTVFSVSFIFWDNADIRVIHRDASAVETVWVEGTQYTLTGGNGATGTLTVKTVPTDYTPASGTTLTIKDAQQELQGDSLPLSGAFPSTVVEQRLDKLTRLIQIHSEEIARSILLPESTLLSGLTIPEPGAGELVRWNAGGTDLETVAVGDVSTAIDTLLTGLATNDFLRWDNAQSAWVNITPGATGLNLFQDATAGDARTELGLGTAATVNTGVSNGQVPLMDATGYPAADGSQITDIVPDANKAPPEISNGTDADHDIDIASGYCRAENAAAKITNAALTKQLDAPWAAGTGAGGNDQAQLDGAQTVTFNDNGASPDDVTIDSGTWTYTPVAGDTLVVVGGTNAGSYQITAGTTTVINVATGSFAADAASASAIYVVKANTWYHLYVIRNSTTLGVDAVFTEGAGSPTNLPSGYDQYRGIASMLTDANANIIGLYQHGDRFYFKTRVHDVDVANMGSTRQTPTISTPLGKEVIALLHVQMRNVGASTGVVNSPDDDDVAPSASHNDLQSENANARPATNMERKTNTSSQIAYRGDGSGANFDLWTLGWIDSRGRNA